MNLYNLEGIIMSISVDNLSAMNEELKTVQTGAKNIAYRA